MIKINNRITSDWIRGFTDGEGCFYVGINKNNTMTMKVQILPEFTIIQHKIDIKLLHEIKIFFGCGLVKRNNKNVMCYSVRNLKHLNNIIIPFFDNNPLLTSKKFNFIKFRWIVRSMVEKKYHLDILGLNKIKAVKKRMNTQKNNKIESNLLEIDG